MVPEEKQKENFPNIAKIPTPTQMQIIGYILENKNKQVYQKELEEKLNLRRATISDLLQRMEKNGLIKRDISQNDIRTKTVELTERAKKFFELGNEQMKKLEEKAIKNIGSEELQVFSDVVNKMIKNINE